MSLVIDTNTLDYYLDNEDYELVTKLPVKAKSYMNETHGKLTARMPYIKVGDKTKTIKWLCECTCGRWGMLPEEQFNAMKSCGCGLSNKILGKRHGHIKCEEKVIDEIEGKKYLYYRVKCDCGKEVFRPLFWVLRATSCGPECKYYSKNDED